MYSFTCMKLGMGPTIVDMTYRKKSRYFTIKDLAQIRDLGLPRHILCHKFHNQSDISWSVLQCNINVYHSFVFIIDMSLFNWP